MTQRLVPNVRLKLVHPSPIGDKSILSVGTGFGERRRHVAVSVLSGGPSVLSLRHPVAHAALGEDVGRVLGVVAQLAAQSP